MRRLARWAAATVLLYLLPLFPAHTSTPQITLEPGASSMNLTPLAMLWHDATGERTLNDWLQLGHANAKADPAGASAAGFAQINAAQESIGRRTGALWVAVRLYNPQAPLLRHLEVSPPRLEALDAWLLAGQNGNTVQALGRSGLSIPLHEKPLNGNASAWVLTVPHGASTLLLRIQSRTVLQPQLQLWSPQAQVLAARLEDLYQGLEIGALALAALLALVFALWLRESTWAWYAGASLSMLVYQTCFNGMAALWLWPEQLRWTLPTMSLALASAHASWVMFFLRFSPAHVQPAWARACAVGLAGISALGVLLVFLVDFWAGVSLQEFAALLLPVVLPWLAWRAWRTGYEPARFLLLGSACLAIASLMRVAMARSWIPTVQWVEDWFLPLSTVLVAAAMMLALADRLRLTKQQQILKAVRDQEALQAHIRDATAELEHSLDLAQAAVLLKNRFVARVSHDLRTPLHTLLGNASLAQSYLDQLAPMGKHAPLQRLREFVMAMKQSGGDMLQLSDELLELTRGNEGQLVLNTAPSDLVTLVRDVAGTMLLVAQHQGNRLQLDTVLAVPLVEIDAVRVQQVLRNLLANACAATRDGVITLGMHSAPTEHVGMVQLEVRVSDTGFGIAPEDLERIFEPFEQLGASAKTGSAGLGLAIARQWVRMMGSDITVQSSPGYGSVFSWSMRVPAASAPPSTNTEDAPLANHARSPQGHILVVDDDANEQQFLQQVLKGLGLQVSLVSSEIEAIAELSVGTCARVDLVITGQDMAHGDGQALLRWCRQERPALAVLLLSGNNQFNVSFDANLCKPVNPALLLQTLQRLLPPPLNWAELRTLAERGDGLGVDAWIAHHRHRLGSSPMTEGVIKLASKLQLAALARWLR